MKKNTNRSKRLFLLLFVLAIFITIFTGCEELDFKEDIDISEEPLIEDEENLDIDKDGYYNSKDEVALYLSVYEELPENYITKKEARELGWDSKQGNLWEVADGMSIGGDKFGNREGYLPEKEGRQYYECDINYQGGHRGAERIVYSDDGLIYYTGDHYNTFTLIYGDE